MFKHFFLGCSNIFEPEHRMSNKVLQYNVANKGRIKREEKAKIVASVWEDKDNFNPLVPGDFFSRISLPKLVERCIA